MHEAVDDRALMTQQQGDAVCRRWYRYLQPPPMQQSQAVAATKNLVCWHCPGTFALSCASLRRVATPPVLRRFVDHHAQKVGLVPVKRKVIRRQRLAAPLCACTALVNQCLQVDDAVPLLYNARRHYAEQRQQKSGVGRSWRHIRGMTTHIT